LTAVAVAAIISGIAFNAYAADNGEENNANFPGWINERMLPGIREWSRAGSCGRGCYRFVEVSEEFEENVVNIAKSDSDVQDLLDDGYNITGVRPIIKSVIEADGNVETKVTSAIVTLEKDTTGHASIWVDIQEENVTEIVILTRTVIEK
jgi:urocanate hydratase